MRLYYLQQTEINFSQILGCYINYFLKPVAV